MEYARLAGVALVALPTCGHRAPRALISNSRRALREAAFAAAEAAWRVLGFEDAKLEFEQRLAPAT